MLLRHATLARNLPSIIKAGLLTSKSQGKLPVVWLHTPAKSFWAKRVRHLSTNGRLVFNSAAMVLFSLPSAAASTMRARNTRRFGVLRPRAQRSRTWRSSPLNVICGATRTS